MLGEEDIKALIVSRLFAADDSCNSTHIVACNGQIRALVAVLNEGRPCAARAPARTILDAAQIPYEVIGDEVEIQDDWMMAHGFEKHECEGEEPIYEHPKFGHW